MVVYFLPVSSVSSFQVVIYRRHIFNIDSSLISPHFVLLMLSKPCLSLNISMEEWETQFQVQLNFPTAVHPALSFSPLTPLCLSECWTVHHVLSPRCKTPAPSSISATYLACLPQGNNVPQGQYWFLEAWKLQKGWNCWSQD